MQRTLRWAQAWAPTTARPLQQLISLRWFGVASPSPENDGGMLVVHPRQSPHHVLDEAQRLAESYTGVSQVDQSSSPAPPPSAAARPARPAPSGAPWT